jgi:hypothetical protein
MGNNDKADWIPCGRVHCPALSDFEIPFAESWQGSAYARVKNMGLVTAASSQS